MPEEERKDNLSVPFDVHMKAMELEERHIRRLVYTIIFTVILLFASNAAWLWFFNQFTIATESTVTVDGKEGTASYIGGNGDITNGENFREDGRGDTGY